MNNPKVSLLVTTYNRCEELKKTLHSIEMQDYPNIEVVIKDGGSTDGTDEIVAHFKRESKHTVVFDNSQDDGLYDAMNKAYQLSSGDIIAVMNDIYLSTDVVRKMVLVIENTPESIGAHADLIYTNEKGQTVRTWKMGPQKSIKTGWMPGHPTLFLKREIYEQYGSYDTTYQIAADYEFMVRFLKNPRNRLEYLPETIISMYYGGTSNSSIDRYFVSFREGMRALKENHVYPIFIISLLRMVRVLCQFVRI